MLGGDAHWHLQFVKNCATCSIVSGGGKVACPPLHPIPVQRPFQIIDVDAMGLPRMVDGNSHVVVFEDYLTKWPLVFPVPDQKTTRLVHCWWTNWNHSGARRSVIWPWYELVITFDERCLSPTRYISRSWTLRLTKLPSPMWWDNKALQ